MLLKEEKLLYIHYENETEAKQRIKEFAQQNADNILAEIALCKEPVARLFLEYFYDGQCVDFHAKLGTESLCAPENEDYFQFAVDLMAERIQKKAVEVLNTTEDYACICEMYD